MNAQDISNSPLPPLPEWAKRDDLGGMLPSQVREALTDHARTAWNMGLNYGLQHAPAVTDIGLPELRDLLNTAQLSGQPINLSAAAAGALHLAMTTGQDGAPPKGWRQTLRDISTETFGQYSEATARAAIDGCIDALDELDSAPQPAPVEAASQGSKRWVVMTRPGKVPVRKGPLANGAHVESMLRDLYELHDDCTCIVIDMPDECYPGSGIEWLDMHGDKRRKPVRRLPAAAPQPEAGSAGVAEVEPVLWAALNVMGRVVYSHESRENVVMNSAYIKTPTTVVGLAAMPQGAKS